MNRNFKMIDTHPGYIIDISYLYKNQFQGAVRVLRGGKEGWRPRELRGTEGGREGGREHHAGPVVNGVGARVRIIDGGDLSDFRRRPYAREPCQVYAHEKVSACVRACVRACVCASFIHVQRLFMRLVIIATFESADPHGTSTRPFTPARCCNCLR